MHLTKYMLPEHRTSIEIAPDNTIYFKKTSNDGRCIYTDRIIRNYFEVTIESLNVGEEMRVSVSVGFASTPYPSFRMPGWEYYSIAVNSARGNVLLNDRSGKGVPYMEPFREGDVIGAGYWQNTQDPNFDDFFFTLNGRYMGIAYTTDCLRDVAFGAIGLIGNARMKVNFGEEPFVWHVANLPSTRIPMQFTQEQTEAGNTYPGFANNVDGLRVAVGNEWDGDRKYNAEGKVIFEENAELPPESPASKRNMGVRRMSFVGQDGAAAKTVYPQQPLAGASPAQPQNVAPQQSGGDVRQQTSTQAQHQPGQSSAAALIAAAAAATTAAAEAMVAEAAARKRAPQSKRHQDSESDEELRPQPSNVTRGSSSRDVAIQMDRLGSKGPTPVERHNSKASLPPERLSSKGSTLNLMSNVPSGSPRHPAQKQAHDDDDEEEESDASSEEDDRMGTNTDAGLKALEQMRAAAAIRSQSFGRGSGSAVIRSSSSFTRGGGVAGLDHLDAIVAGGNSKNPPPPSAAAARRSSQDPRDPPGTTKSDDVRIELGRSTRK